MVANWAGTSGGKLEDTQPKEWDWIALEFIMLNGQWTRLGG